MMKLKTILKNSKMVSLFLVSSLAFSVSTNANAAELEVSEWVEKEENIILNKKIESELKATKEEDFLLIHNQGNPIETDILNNDSDFYLDSISVDIVNGVEVTNYHFNEKGSKTRSLNEIKEDLKVSNNEVEKDVLKSISSQGLGVASNISKQNLTTKAVANSNYYFKTYSWSFNNNAHTLHSSVTLNRLNSSAIINGVRGSVWDVSTVTQYVRKTGKRYLNNQYTRLAVPYTYQSLADWGPESSNNNTVSFGLSGIVPQINYSFTLGSYYSVKDLSNASQKYGRWNFAKRPSLSYPSSLKTAPAIRTTNTKGNLAVQLSHSLHFDAITNNTGVITITVPDR